MEAVTFRELTDAETDVVSGGMTAGQCAVAGYLCGAGIAAGQFWFAAGAAFGAWVGGCFD